MLSWGRCYCDEIKTKDKISNVITTHLLGIRTIVYNSVWKEKYFLMEHSSILADAPTRSIYQVKKKKKHGIKQKNEADPESPPYKTVKRRKKSKSKITLYYYTTENGARGIEKDGIIKISTTEDRRPGHGTDDARCWRQQNIQNQQK